MWRIQSKVRPLSETQLLQGWFPASMSRAGVTGRVLTFRGDVLRVPEGGPGPRPIRAAAKNTAVKHAAVHIAWCH